MVTLQSKHPSPGCPLLPSLSASKTLLIPPSFSPRIQEDLLHALNSHSSNWPSAVQHHALALLRSGEVSTFPALIRRVLDDIRQETSSAASGDHANNGTSSPKNNGDTNGTPNGNGKASGAATNGNAAANGADSAAQLALPTPVIDSVLRATRESLEAVCDVDDSANGA